MIILKEQAGDNYCFSKLGLHLPVFEVNKYWQQESGKNILTTELHNYYSVPNIRSARVIKPRTMEWVVHIARTRTMGNSYETLVGVSKEWSSVLRFR
jgi:hypothetical protein